MARTLIVPSFRSSELNKKEDGSIMTHKETLKLHIGEAIDTYDGDLDDCMVLCVAEKIKDDDYRYGLACVSTKEKDILGVSMPTFKELPEVVVTNKISKFKTIVRILNNMTFS